MRCHQDESVREVLRWIERAAAIPGPENSLSVRAWGRAVKSPTTPSDIRPGVRGEESLGGMRTQDSVRR